MLNSSQSEVAKEEVFNLSEDPSRKSRSRAFHFYPGLDQQETLYSLCGCSAVFGSSFTALFNCWGCSIKKENSYQVLFRTNSPPLIVAGRSVQSCLRCISWTPSNVPRGCGSPMNHAPSLKAPYGCFGYAVVSQKSPPANVRASDTRGVYITLALLFHSLKGDCGQISIWTLGWMKS